MNAFGRVRSRSIHLLAKTGEKLLLRKPKIARIIILLIIFSYLCYRNEIPPEALEKQYLLAYIHYSAGL